MPAWLSPLPVNHAAGGKVAIPKTPIGADRGFFARFLDPEGNLVGLCGLA